MNYKDTLHNLKYEAHIHRNDKVATGATDITAMCEDVIETLEDCIPKDILRKLLEEKVKIRDSLSYETYHNEREVHKLQIEIHLLKQLLEEE